MADGSDPALAAGIDLFNRGRYLAAHELFDELWESTEGEAADFYKGLIQAAVCLHHWQQSNPAGARKLYAGHRRSLAGYPSRYRGIDVEAFLASMRAALAPLLAAREGEEPALDDAARPRIERSGG